jgi:hypothetical protein
MDIRRFAAGLLVLAACFGSLADEQDDLSAPRFEGPSIEDSPAAVIERMRKYYAERAIAEEITLRVTSAGQTQGDRIVFRHVPGVGMRLEMGAINAVLDAAGLSAEHRANRAVYFRATTVDGDALATLRRSLPPMPIVQPTLALSKHPDADGMSPFLVGVRWTDAKTYLEAKPPSTVLVGQSGHARGVIVSDAQSGAVISVTTWLDDGATVIEARSAGLDAPVSEDLAFDAAGREPSDRITSLAPSSADVRIGDALPVMKLTPWPESGAGADLRGPGAALFFTNYLNFKAAQSASLAAATIARGVEGFRMFPVLVFEPIQPEKRLMLTRIGSIFNATGLWYTAEPGATIGRFVIPEDRAAGENLLVGWDAAGKVALVVPVDAGATPESITELVTGALRVR